jgi:hypothetical protein
MIKPSIWCHYNLLFEINLIICLIVYKIIKNKKYIPLFIKILHHFERFITDSLIFVINIIFKNKMLIIYWWIKNLVYYMEHEYKDN